MTRSNPAASRVLQPVFPSGPKRIAVIGAGAVGLSSALHLRRAGHAVEVFDPRGPGEGASFGNAGIIAVSEVLPIGRPAILAQAPRMLLSRFGPLAIRPRYLPAIAPWLIRLVLASRPAQVRRLSGQLATLLAHAVPAWRDLTAGRPAARWLATRGWLRAYSDPTELARAEHGAATLRALGVAVEILRSAEVAELEPALTSLAGGLFFPDAGHLLSPIQMMRALAEDAREAGVIFHTTEVARLERGAEPVLVDNDGRSGSFDGVVVAAGAWSQRLLRTLEVNFPLDTERGYHLMLPTPGRSLTRPVSLPVPGYTLAQMADGVRLTTGVEFAGLDAPPDFRRAYRMLAHARAVLPGLAGEPCAEWLGFRPSMPDSLPVIGPLRRHPKVIAAFGHGHLGVTLGPVTGAMIAALASGRAPRQDVTPFMPSRFGE